MIAGDGFYFFILNELKRIADHATPLGARSEFIATLACDILSHSLQLQ